MIEVTRADSLNRVLRDGDYVSAYLNPAGIYRLAGVRFRHDENFALWRVRQGSVQLVAHWQLERLSGQKGHRTPMRSVSDQRAYVNSLLAEHGASLESAVEVWGTPGISTVDEEDLIQLPPGLSLHSVSHLFSAVLLDSEKSYNGAVLGMAIDFAPDRILDRNLPTSWYAGCFVDHGELRFFPIESPGALYCAARDRFGLREGTLMALATATSASIEVDVRELVERTYWGGHQGMLEAADEIIAELEVLAEIAASTDERFSHRDNVISAVMKVVQDCSFEILSENVRRAIELFDIDTESTALALAGGSALNCPTNSRLLEEFGFLELIAPPSVADDGQAIGIGLAAMFARSKSPFAFSYSTPYLGPSRPDADVDKYSPFIASLSPYDRKVAVDDLLDGPIVWVEGRSEVGPRALGHRSILADPQQIKSKDLLNEMKGREWWRPVAPLVLLSEGGNWFEGLHRSPYMLETFAIRESLAGMVPAIAHLDTSARVQTIDDESSDLVVDLLHGFAERSSVPMLCNTSLNDAGEPIIESAGDALNFALRKGIRVAYIHGQRLELQGHEDYVGYAPGVRSDGSWFQLSEEELQHDLRAANPHGLSEVELYVYLTSVEHRHATAIQTAEGAMRAKRLAAVLLDRQPSLRELAASTMRKNTAYFDAFGSYPLVPEPRFFDFRATALGAK